MNSANTMRYLLGTILFLCLLSSSSAVYVYQEQADVATSLGTFSNGTYAAYSVCTLENTSLECTDGGDGVEAYAGFIFINYTKASSASAFVSQYKISNGTGTPTSNVTIPSTCFNLLSTGVQLRIISTATQVFVQCKNNTGTDYTYVATDNWSNTNWYTIASSTGISNSLPKDTNYGLRAFDADYFTGTVFSLNGGFGNWALLNSTFGVQGGSVWEEGVYWFFNNTLNLSFYDENSGVLLNGTTVTYYATNGLNTVSGSTSTGSALVTDLYYGNYTVTYSAIGYEQRSTLVSVDAINDTQSLYLLSSTNASTILVGVYDTLTHRVASADVYSFKKNLSGTNYYLVESCTTDARGECLMNLQLYDTFYKFTIYYGGELKLTSNDSQLSNTVLSFTINLQDFSIADIFKVNSITGNVTTNRSVFTFNYTDSYNIISSACLETVRRDGSTLTVSATNCSTSTSGGLNLGFLNTTGDEWIGNGYVILAANGRRYDIDSFSYVVSDFKSKFGRVGLFYFGFLLLGTMVFSAMYSIVASLVMAGVGVWIMNALGFISVGTSGVVSLLIVIVIYIITVKNT